MHIYVSEIDRLLSKLEIAFPHKSDSRIIEEEKYLRIFTLRDRPINYPASYIFDWE